MKRLIFMTRCLIGILIVMMVPYGAFAQDTGPTPVTFSKAQLDQMLAPIALYPDSLLAQILIAATYPDQVLEANNWLKAHPDLQGDALNNALDATNWDLSVKALAPFPQILDMMAQQSDWTEKLGEAFLAQQTDVMASIQGLRRAARAAGNLQSNEQQKVVVEGDDVEIEPTNPEVVYVPDYNPEEVYGDWSWPDYPPFAYYPCCWPFGFGIGFGWGYGFGFWAGVPVGPIWGWGWGLVELGPR